MEDIRDKITVTPNIIEWLAKSNFIFSFLRVFFFLIKRSPLHYKPIWEGFFSNQIKEQKCFTIFKIVILNMLNTIMKFLRDKELVFHLLILVFSSLGAFRHKFFFSVHLMLMIVRHQLLQNVVKAFYEPWWEIFLTIIMFFIFEYYFSIIGYLAFYKDYPEGSCDTLIKCW